MGVSVLLLLEKLFVASPAVCVMSLLIPDYFLPYDQVGGAIPGSFEAAIHAVHHSLSQFGNNESLTIHKLDMKIAFNECCYSLIVKSFQEFPLGLLVLQSAC